MEVGDACGAGDRRSAPEMLVYLVLAPEKREEREEREGGNKGVNNVVLQEKD